MFQNYLKIFLRLFARNRTFTAINLLGLSTGLACFVLIRLYVINETSYDRHLDLHSLCQPGCADQSGNHYFPDLPHGQGKPGRFTPV